jgi:thiamine kinase-like enzyme
VRDDRRVQDVVSEVFERCRAALPGWRSLSIEEVELDDPKGFSSFTMAVRPRRPVDPPAVLYRGLAGKENAILDAATERDTFLLLGRSEIAAHCYHYDDDCRIEEFYAGRTLDRDDVFVSDTRRKIADQLYRLHQLEPVGLPAASYFELIHERWAPMARAVLTEHRDEFPHEERVLCDDLLEICSDETTAKVLRCLPDRPPVFCHNDTYHGNVMLLDDGRVRLLDFEFSCRNHIAFDFANLFAETVMRHGLDDPPFFDIAPPDFTDADLADLIGHYLANATFATDADRDAELARLLDETRLALLLPDYMYAMAACTLARRPIQRLRFIPYAHRRFRKFLGGWDATFANGD